VLKRFFLNFSPIRWPFHPQKLALMYEEASRQERKQKIGLGCKQLDYFLTDFRSQAHIFRSEGQKTTGFGTMSTAPYHVPSMVPIGDLS
jgi:hypothetical protein